MPLTLLLFLLGILSAQAVPVSIMAANISSGSSQSYDPGEGARIFRGLKPDIVLIQEFNIGTNSDQDLRNFVTDNFGADFSYIEEGKPTSDIQNGIISRYPILDSGIWDDFDMRNREFVWARLDVPGPKNLLAVSVHFKASSGTTNVNRRRNQGRQLAGYVAAEKQPDDLVVIGGDFNFRSRETTREPALGHLATVVSTTGPYPVDRNGVGGTNASRRLPYDWVLADAALSDLEVPTSKGGRDFPNGLVFDSRVFQPLSAVPPVRQSDSGAINMQHMAVIRTFNFPENIDLYEKWARHYFGGDTAPELADPDQDGLVNLVEFAFGTDPTAPGSTLDIQVDARPDQTTIGTLSFNVRANSDSAPVVDLGLLNWPAGTDAPVRGIEWNPSQTTKDSVSAFVSVALRFSLEPTTPQLLQVKVTR